MTMKHLTDFGWSEAQSPTDQRTALQAALDTGGATYFRGVCTVDGPVYMDQPGTTLFGAGATIKCSVDCDVLTVRESYTNVCGITFEGALARQGAAVAIGPKLDGDFAIYVHLERLQMPLLAGDPNFDYGHSFGVHLKKGGGLTIRGGMIGGRTALRWDNAVVDAGDCRIVGADINASNLFDYPTLRGMGLYWTAGGGLYVENCKFNQGKYHARIESSLGSTGSLMFQNNSFEGNVDASIDLMGNTYMNRVHVQGNSFGVLGRALTVRNFMFPSGVANAWLHGFVMDGNTIERGGPDAANPPLVEIGYATEPLIGANRIQGTGSHPGIVIYPQCVGGKVNAAGSIITGCTPAIDNQGTGTQTAQGGGAASLNDLADVDMTGGQAGQYLQIQGDGIVRPDTPS